MSTVAVTSHLPTNAPIASAYAELAKQRNESYLAKCTYRIQPESIADLEKTAKICVYITAGTIACATVAAATFFTIAGIITTTFFTFSAVTGIAAGIGFAVFMKKIVVSKMIDEVRTVQRHYQDLTQQTLPQIQYELARRGILWNRIPTISMAGSTSPHQLYPILPILARIQYLENLIQKEEQNKNELDAKALQLAANQPQRGFFTEYNKEKISELRSKAQRIEEKILETKIQAAFAQAVLSQGDYRGFLDNVGSLGFVADNIFMFKNRTIAPITSVEAKTMNIAQLSQRFQQALSAPQQPAQA